MVFCLCLLLICVLFISKGNRVLFVCLGQVLHRQQSQKCSEICGIKCAPILWHLSIFQLHCQCCPLRVWVLTALWCPASLCNIFSFLLNLLLICRTNSRPMVSQIPTSVDPVNAILSMPIWEAIAAPAVGPNPGKILMTPGGKPA